MANLRVSIRVFLIQDSTAQKMIFDHAGTSDSSVGERRRTGLHYCMDRNLAFANDAKVERTMVSRGGACILDIIWY